MEKDASFATRGFVEPSSGDESSVGRYPRGPSCASKSMPLSAAHNHGILNGEWLVPCNTDSFPNNPIQKTALDIVSTPLCGPPLNRYSHLVGIVEGHPPVPCARLGSTKATRCGSASLQFEIVWEQVIVLAPRHLSQEGKQLVEALPD